MVRFKNGEPIAVHLSAHADGHSWGWHTMEKIEGRPVAYVASGSRECLLLVSSEGFISFSQTVYSTIRCDVRQERVNTSLYTLSI